MFNRAHFENKRILVLGLGLTGMSFVRFLTKHNLPFSVNDSRTGLSQFDDFYSQYPHIDLVTGSWSSRLIIQADIIFVSPGVDTTAAEIANFIQPSCDVLGDIELYARISDVPCVAVTGSNGKSTVVNLVHHIGQELGVKTQLGGNVGVPVLDTLDDAPELMVMELSSFQLETISSLKPKAACVLNLSDDHLDRHKTMQVYGELKRRIYNNADTLVFNVDDKATYPESIHAENVIGFTQAAPSQQQYGISDLDGQLMLTYGETSVIPVAELPISGIHNATNIMAALAIGKAVGWDMQAMVAALPTFKGLPHRFERVASNDDLFWINDSKATNVGATIAAIEGLAPTLSDSQQLILIAGGEGKGADFTPLKTPIAQHISWLIALGKDKSALTLLTENASEVDTMDQAVALARQKSQKGDVILLSPACASIDMFANFVARGEAFVSAIAQSREAS
ncbi:UDP-N-acetylmuramoyl-L-alanine--D-glutamate ligase [Thalassotalea euphylliae]|uniref:UDP-N-acetylmuramoyl-L-alanine--D-glutamate ligase n=1 Tax=Thalassotalea euphylliae TaxID=1655234 RepID=UPI00362872C3